MTTFRCTRSTDGREYFLLSIFRYNERPPEVYHLDREATEDLVQEITSAVRSYDTVNKDKVIASEPDPMFPGDDGPAVA